MQAVHIPELKAGFTNGAGPILCPIKDNDLVDLQVLLNNHQSPDPYQSSASYFAMTGRNGLWLAKEGDDAVIICRHPNVENEFLIFPPIGNNGSSLLAKTIASVSKTSVNVSLARASEAVAKKLISLNSKVQLKRVPEQILDWAFPVHVLDTAKVAIHSGNEFQQFRTKLNKINAEHIEVLDLDLATHHQAVFDIVKNWAQGDGEKIAPYMRMLDLHDKVPMAGRLVMHEGKPAGFSIWEETFPKRGLANAYAHLGLHSVEGMARYVMLDMCQTLQKKGFSKVCIGGSETAGLDQFKRQLRPVQSIPFGFSWQVTPTGPILKKSRPVMAITTNLTHLSAK